MNLWSDTSIGGIELINQLIWALLLTLFTFQSCPNPGAIHCLIVKGDYEMKSEYVNSHLYAGMWVTADGYIRHELLPNGRYDEARGNRKSAYQGSYTIEGNHIEYVDDTGFTADGDFVDGVLYHAGMVLYLEEDHEGSKE